MNTTTIPVIKRLFWFLGGISLFRLAVAGSFQLSMDEGYYWQWAKHLNLSYYDHPPMVALSIAATTIFSDHELFVRMAAVLGAAIGSYLLYRLTEEVTGRDIAGLRTVWIANITLLFAAGAITPTPDTPLIPFYIGAMLFFWKGFNKEPDAKSGWKEWLAGGLCAGGAILSKYTAFFFYPCALLFLLLSPRGRQWIVKPQPWAAVILSFVCFTPVIVWNAQHDWASLSFQAGHGLGGGGFRPGLFGEFIGFQMILYSIGIFFFMLWGLWLATKRVFNIPSITLGRDAALYLVCFSVPQLLFFTANSFRSRMEGNWPVLAFIPLFILTGLLVSRWNLRERPRRFWYASVALALIMFGFLHLQLVNPVIPHPQRYEISRRVYGWKTLAAHVDTARQEINARFLIANRHQLTGLMNYYTNPHLISYVLAGNDRRYFYLPQPDTHLGENAVYVVEKERDEITTVSRMFHHTAPAGEVTITRKGELIRQFVLYKCYNYRGGLK